MVQRLRQRERAALIDDRLESVEFNGGMLVELGTPPEPVVDVPDMRGERGRVIDPAEEENKVICVRVWT